MRLCGPVGGGAGGLACWLSLENRADAFLEGMFESQVTDS